MYSSKYVAARLGMNNDTLRKWAIRYQLAPSARSTTGRYSYTDSDIVRLQMVLQLRQLGCALPDLAQMTLPQLAQKLPKSEKVAKQTLAIIGEPLSFTSQLLPLKLHYCELEMAMMLGLPTLMQCGSIGKHNLDAIFALRAATPSLLVCFRFANKSDRLALEAQGVETHSDPLEVKTVVAWLNNKIQNRQFSDPLLEKIDAWLPNLSCDCPSHLRKLLGQLRSFSDYSQQCSVNNQQDAILHQQFLVHSRNAEREIENAMRLLIEYEAEKEKTPALSATQQNDAL